MNSKIQLFQNEEFGRIRAVEIDGQPWFVGKDVAEALGYSNSRKALGDHVDVEDKGVTNCDTPGGLQQLNVINESGLYSLILSSKLPTAKQFKRWVTSEVLPSIRKHGAYMTDGAMDAAVKDPGFINRLISVLRDERDKNTALQEHLIAVVPKARYCELILQTTNTVPIGLIAKDYGMSAVTFNKLLNGLHIQYRLGGTWVLYQQYAGKGYTRSYTFRASPYTTSVQTNWTQKGRLFLYELLREYGIMPMVECCA